MPGRSITAGPRACLAEHATAWLLEESLRSRPGPRRIAATRQLPPGYPPDAHDHRQLLLSQSDLLVIVLIIDGAQGLAAVVARQQRVQLVAALPANQLLTCMPWRGGVGWVSGSGACHDGRRAKVPALKTSTHASPLSWPTRSSPLSPSVLHEHAPPPSTQSLD